MSYNYEIKGNEITENAGFIDMTFALDFVARSCDNTLNHESKSSYTRSSLRRCRQWLLRYYPEFLL